MSFPSLFIKRAPFDAMWVYFLRVEFTPRRHKSPSAYPWAFRPLTLSLVRRHYEYGPHTRKLKRIAELIIINNKIIEEFSVGPTTIHFYVWKKKFLAE